MPEDLGADAASVCTGDLFVSVSTFPAAARLPGVQLVGLLAVAPSAAQYLDLDGMLLAANHPNPLPS